MSYPWMMLVGALPGSASRLVVRSRGGYAGDAFGCLREKVRRAHCCRKLSR